MGNCIMVIDTVIPIGRDNIPNPARQKLNRFDRQQLDRELLLGKTQTIKSLVKIYFIHYKISKYLFIFRDKHS